METPVLDFVKNYNKSGACRAHMPGHKGKGVLGVEGFDLTEIEGADSLYHSNGIIEQSRKNACKIFGAQTFYVTEGSSQSIRTMVYLISLIKADEKPIKILAARNVHKSFVTAAALCGVEVNWLYGDGEQGYLSCAVTAKDVETALKEEKFSAVYLTSPDYLGNVIDLKGIAAVCRKHGALFVVDNAHGAYLKFLNPSIHPIDLGADMCCDSAHKTLSAVTGAAYLHVNNRLKIDKEKVLLALSLFGSTSPSYLTIASLDALNAYLDGEYKSQLLEFVGLVDALKERLIKNGYTLIGNEKLKITIDAKKYGYFGEDFAKILQENGVVCEFSDCDYVVLMLSPNNSALQLEKIERVLTKTEKRKEISKTLPTLSIGKKVLSIRKATFSSSELLPIEKSEGRILAAVSVSCPPAVPILVCGEMIDKAAIERFKYYKITHVLVVK